MIYSTYQDELNSALRSFEQKHLDWILDQVLSAARSSRKIFVIGNGGSASTASHMACDFQKWAHTLPAEAKRLPVISLSDNLAVISAIGNDSGFDHVFSDQLEALGDEGDLLIAISVSGQSPNILRAIETANRMHMFTVVLVGKGCSLGSTGADGGISIGSSDYGIVEDCHAIIMHMLTRMVREYFSAK